MCAGFGFALRSSLNVQDCGTMAISCRALRPLPCDNSYDFLYLHVFQVWVIGIGIAPRLGAKDAIVGRLMQSLQSES